MMISVVGNPLALEHQPDAFVPAGLNFCERE
jgi:hypothetical protein